MRPLLVLATLAACVRCSEAAECADQHETCKAWAKAGECDANPGFMQVECALSCDTCAYAAELSSLASHKCDDIGEDSISSGGVSAQMERMLALEAYAPRLLHQDPYVLLFENFTTRSEAAEIIRVGGHKFERSLAGFSDGKVASRTSDTSWCNVPKCEHDPVMIELKRRITEALSCPLRNTEHLQLLRYDPGQFYRLHHDQNSPVDSPPGPRVWTFFLYLSDVEEGGETAFPLLNLTVRPMPGTAIVWHSVRDANVYEDELRTEHEARPVVTGRKFAANFWTHLRDFQSPHAARCGTDAVPSATQRRLDLEAARVDAGERPNPILNAAIQGIRPTDPRLGAETPKVEL